jgi:hypothetical protein
MKAKKKEKIRVTVMSHDSWSGPEVLYTKEFATEKAAENFCKKFNAKNTAPTAPEYYETATIGDGWGYTR